MAIESGSIILNKYKIKRVLGQGGMGKVYEIQELSAQKRFAMKEMIDIFDKVDESESAVAQFRGEATLLMKLSHPNIPKVIDYFSIEKSHFMIMEYIDGTDLDKLLKIRSNPFSEITVARWGIEICRVLHYLHIQKPPVIFRDIKPGNIILTTDGRLVLLDFGIARIFKVYKNKDTFALGTEGYAAPEQYVWGPKQQSDPKSDIYALGATLYHLATGIIPDFSFGSINKLSPAMEVIIKKATMPDSSMRYESAKELKRAMTNLLSVLGNDKSLLNQNNKRNPKPGIDISLIKEVNFTKPSITNQPLKICRICNSAINVKSRFCIRCGARMPII